MTGEKVSNTEWHNVVVRNKAAEICEKYLNKGDKIYVEGKIKPENGSLKMVYNVIQLKFMLMNSTFFRIKPKVTP